MALNENIKRFFRKLVGQDGDATGPSDEMLQAAAKQPSVPTAALPVKPKAALPLVGNESLMAQKAHGTTATAVQEDLRWGCSRTEADKICSYNRHYAEYAGYYTKTSFLKQADRTGPTTFYDSVTGLPLFTAPIGRTFEEFERESRKHGWPSFRDQEVHWENMRCLKNGEAVSLAGTHLGHNLPDRNGNRYCINLVSVAGRPMAAEE
mmetsp:Transcript_16298/g.41679  ORF Transcript_16298/g.41679 Transcript_16298/m.41679 type:complete len:207 (-) Transcript_16298:1574-2194(-)|eukprot:jgi/Tetstr1/449159/TSEL_036368.t1